MKLAISNIAWDNFEEEEVANLLQDFSVEGVEIAPTKIWKSPIEVASEEIQEYRNFWNTRGVNLVAMQSLLFGKPELQLFESQESRDSLKNYLTQIIELASKLGVRTLVFGSPKNRIRGNLSLDDAMNIAVPFFDETGTISSKNGVIVSIEANPKEYGCDFITSTVEGIDLVKKVNNSGFRFHIDTGGMILNREDYRFIKEALPYTSHFHISEPFLEMPSNLEFHKLLAAELRKEGYTQWVSIEMKNNLSSSNVDSVKKAVETAMEIYHN